jgi:ankyrin repeat domain-containing protein 50
LLPWTLRRSSSDIGLSLLLTVQTRFLLVVLQIDDVLTQETPAKAEAAAQSIKFDLSLAYEKMLSRIHPHGLKLLHWVLFARRSLSLEELRFAVAIEEGMTDLDPKRQLPFPSFIDFALGLVVVDSEERTVRFAHLTIKDYLADHSLQYFPDGHGLLARTCLTYLSFSALSTDTGQTRFLEDGDLYPFFEYAESNWGHHTRESEDDTTTCDMTLNWLLSKNFTQVQVVRGEGRSYNHWDFGVDYLPLHETCFFGLHSLTAKLLESGSADINACDSDQVTPLLYAVRCNHLAVLKGLCQCSNLDVNAQNNFGYTPLQDASWDGLFDIVQILLQHPSIEIDLQDVYGRTALHNAASHGHTNIIQLLLQHPTIDINYSDKNGWTALTTAVDHGHADVVRLLLAHKDIDISASRVGEPGFWESIPPGVYSYTKCMTLPHDLRLQLGIKPSLYLAARDGDKDTVELFLQQPDIEPNAHYGSQDRTPLHEAISGGHLKVVEALLLHLQVDVNSVNKYGRSALMCAVKEGHSGIVKALLQRPDIDINSVDTYGGTALMHAAHEGRSDIMYLFLQHSDINVNQPDHKGWTPLTEAVDEGHTEIVRMLLSHKDIDITASRVWVPELWEMPLPRPWYLKAKHMTLPGDLIAQLGINPCWFTDLEIGLFSGDDSLMAEVDGKQIVDI